MKKPDRYDPRARSVGGPWKMVKCKDGPYVDFEQHREIVADLAAEKEAETRATFDAIRTITQLRDDYAALAAEKEALVQQGIRDHADWRSKLNFLEADYKAEVARLTAENERLRSSELSLEKWIACEQIHFETADNLREKLYQASLEIERLRKAGDAMYHTAQQDGTGLWLHKSFKDWRDAK